VNGHFFIFAGDKGIFDFLISKVKRASKKAENNIFILYLNRCICEQQSKALINIHVLEATLPELDNKSLVEETFSFFL
jgi:hypothetical protein